VSWLSALCSNAALRFQNATMEMGAVHLRLSLLPLVGHEMRCL